MAQSPLSGTAAFRGRGGCARPGAGRGRAVLREDARAVSERDLDRGSTTSSRVWRPGLREASAGAASSAETPAAGGRSPNRPRSWSTQHARSPSKKTITPGRICSSGRKRSAPALRAIGAIWMRELAASLDARLEALERCRAVDGPVDGIRLPDRSRPAAALDRLSGA